LGSKRIVSISIRNAGHCGALHKVAETDGAYFGGYVKPANLHADRKDCRFWRNQSGKRECVVIVRERNGNSVPAVFRSEGWALSWIKSRVQKDTILNADEAPSWNDLHGCFEMRRITHQEAYSLNGARTNWAKSYFSRLRRAEIGHHHHVAGRYCFALPRKHHGARTTAACRTANRSIASPDWRRAGSRQWISQVIGNGIGTRRHEFRYIQDWQSAFELLGRGNPSIAKGEGSAQSTCMRRDAGDFADWRLLTPRC
jgi:hypothetical protein